MEEHRTHTGPASRHGDDRAYQEAECAICVAVWPVGDTITTSTCGHTICHPCIKHMFDLSLKDTAAYMPPRCCGREGILASDVGKVLSPTYMTNWSIRYEEVTAVKPLYCPNKECLRFIRRREYVTSTDGTGHDHALCAGCQEKVCVDCSDSWHGKDKCCYDEDTKEFMRIARRKGWKACPRCLITSPALGAIELFNLSAISEELMLRILPDEKGPTATPHMAMTMTTATAVNMSLGPQGGFP
ncbi:IBR domain [Geosmithia morbida]|uniref:IBR domain n=1 Tax=Geosmithia morbida TaxID=1094350 RepID=A0A9P5D501_9HYPO|nr:IBR domain [Geosmithia morbida]KAF4126662.1 IBR domain [Geosmithia morbida]